MRGFRSPGAVAGALGRCKPAAVAGLVVLAMAALIGSAAAQAPPSATPEQLLERPPVDRPEPTTPGDILSLPPEDRGVIEGDGEKIFVLERVVLEGSEIYSDADVAEMVAEFIGQEVSLADLNRIARVVTLRYRADGFVLSQAVLPPQEVEDGVLRLQAVEGRIVDVRVIGDVREFNDLIRRMANRIVSDRPLNVRDLERYLLLIDDLPGITARGTVQPGAARATGVLLVTVEQDLLEGAIGLDNLGSDFVGRFRGTAVGAVNSAFGLHDRTTVRGIMTGFNNQSRELRFAEIIHEQQVGSDGLRVQARGAITHTHPDNVGSNPATQLRSLGVEGESWSAELQGLYPLIRSRQFNVNLIGGFNAQESKSWLAGVRTSNDRVRHLRFGGNVDFTDSLRGVTQIEVFGEQGVDIFNATDDGSGRTRPHGEHEYLLGTLRATRIQDFVHGFSARATVEGQLSNDPLLASQEVAFGGDDIGRAYDFAEIVGDDGVGGVVELRWAGPPVHDFVESYQIYGFYDFASVWNKSTRELGEPRQQSIASLGGGLRFNLAYGATGFVEVGLPLTKVVGSEGDEDPRFFFSIRKRF